MQAIAQYFKDTNDLETYQNLCMLIFLHFASHPNNFSAMFLWNNYKQALQIIKDTLPLIDRAMKDLGILDVGVFETWLQEEREYLQGLKKEPVEETLQMEYYQRLVNLWASEWMPAVLHILMNVNLFCRSDLVAISNTWSSTTPGAKDNTCVIETRCQHAIENQDKDLATVQALEMRMSITERWICGSAESHEAARLLHMRKYQRALDVLEGLVVAHVFELSKMNC
jgi:hypothetical protein